MGKGWGDPCGKAVADQSRGGKTAKRTLVGARNDKPPFGGLTRPGDGHTLRVLAERGRILTAPFWPCQKPHAVPLVWN
jgi:hypothetical protein